MTSTTVDPALVFEASPVALLVLGADRTVLVANERARALLDERATPGRAITDCFIDGDALSGLFDEPGGQLELSLGRPPAQKMRATTQALADGSWVLSLQTLAPESKRTSDRFDLITRTSGVGYWIKSERQAAPVWNDELRALYGLEPGSPTPTNEAWMQRHMAAADRDDLLRRYRAWIASGEPAVVIPMRILRADGAERHLIAHTQTEVQDGERLVFGVVFDVTDKRDAELALRSAAERAALAASGVGLGTWEYDWQTRAARWDAQMWALRGLEPRDAALSETERLACLHPDDRARAAELIGHATQSGETLDYEFRVVWPDGQVRWLASRSMDLVDPEHGTRRRIGVNWDVTDKRTAQEARHEREMALRESQAKSRFLARMSHELRTPLNAVLGFAQLLLADEKAADAASMQRRRRLEHIRSAGQHLLSLINDVLDLSSLQSGELRVDLQPVPLAALVARTLPLLGPQLDSRRVSVRSEVPDLLVMADAVRLRQVLLNLLSNAVKYNREGGQIRIDAQRRGEQICLRVADNGHGMDEEQLRHLFEPFNRLGREAGGAQDGHEVEGTGIGLAIVKALVERMDGSVQVQSKAGEGTVFEVLLRATPLQSTDRPVASAAAAATPGSAAQDQAEGAHRHRLLYIEDNPVNALIIGELLARRTDLELHIAVDGTSGVARAATLRPELILIDMQLPDFDGFEVLRRLRANPVTALIPCIALSANAMPDDIHSALLAGMSDYWTKPLDFKAFMASIDALFGKAV